MAERFQAANGIGLVVGSNEMQFAVGAFYQTWLALFDQFPYTHHMECGVLLTRK